MLLDIDPEKRMQRKLDKPPSDDDRILEPWVLLRHLAQVVARDLLLGPVNVRRVVALVAVGPEFGRIKLRHAGGDGGVDDSGLVFHGVVAEEADDDVEASGFVSSIVHTGVVSGERGPLKDSGESKGPRTSSKPFASCLANFCFLDSLVRIAMRLKRERFARISCVIGPPT